MEPVSGMNGFVAALGTSFTVDTILANVTPLIPYIAVVTFVAIIWGVFMKMRNKNKKLK